ncbi:MAG: hypothetical protein H7Y13_14085 [Sphingobacteriaceae bacterium]|nr:hypothetical protein [Sphingobacteriaceae bacterium]
MKEINSHIISSFRWNTTFDQKEKASELQERLSGWSRFNMMHEINAVFDRVCPADQVWRIQSLELDLGITDYNNLELELGERLRQQLYEKLIEAIFYAQRNGSQNIEVLNTETSQLQLLRDFLLHGQLSWNYKSQQGTVNELMAYQLQHNRQNAIRMIREAGTDYADVRKRIAWQINERSIIKIIEGLEPNHHREVTGFSDEMVNLQAQESFVQSSVEGFKKELWHWILNYLFAERGTLFNRVAFMKSSIRQMAGHYNIAYHELLTMISEAVDIVSKKTFVTKGFIGTLKLLSEGTDFTPRESQVTDYWYRLECFFNDSSLSNSTANRNEFNELILALSKENTQRFTDLVASGNYSQLHWKLIINQLNNASLENVLAVLSSRNAHIVVESIYFLDKLLREAKLAVAIKNLWVKAFEYILKNTSSAFDNAAFLNHCLSGIKGKDISEQKLYSELLKCSIPSKLKGNVALEVYSSLTKVCFAKLPKTSLSSPEGLISLIDSIAVQLGSGAGKVNSGLETLFYKNVQSNPGKVLKALIRHPDRYPVRQVLNNTVNNYLSYLLIKSSGSRNGNAILMLQEALNELKIHQQIMLPYGKIESQLSHSGLRLMIMHPGVSVPTFLGLLLKDLKETIPALKGNTFQELIEAFLLSKRLQPGISPGIVTALKTKLNKSEDGFSIEKVIRFARIYNRSQSRIGNILQNQFKNDEFVRLRKGNSNQASFLLNHLLSNGKKVMDDFIKEYQVLLEQHVKNSSKLSLAETIKELFWKCILNYQYHRGNFSVFKDAFRTAILYHFPVSRQKLVPATLTEHVIQKCLLKSGTEVTEGTLFSLIEKGLIGGGSRIEQNGITYKLGDLVDKGLELKSFEVARIFGKITISSKTVSVLKADISFLRFIAWILNGVHGELKEGLSAIRSLYEFFDDIASGVMNEKMLELFWTRTLHLIRTNKWTSKDLGQLISDSMALITQDSKIDLEFITVQIRNKKIQPDAGIMDSLSKFIPAIVYLPLKLSNTKSKIVSEAESKGLLEELITYIITQKQLPVWLNASEALEAVNVLNELIEYHPVVFLKALKSGLGTEVQSDWLCGSVKFEHLIKAIGTFDKNKQSQLKIIQNLYKELGNINIPGIGGSELQALLFKKILKAWTSDNWRMISSENIWNELAWDICTKKGITKEIFFKAVQNKIEQLPPALQVSFHLVRESVDRRPKTHHSKNNELPMQNKRVNLPRKNEISSGKGGVAIKNAGLVLLSTYVSMLLERIGLTDGNSFKTQKHQLDAVHYLQYVVTGLTHTEEHLLLFNKILCGLPLSEPIQDGIEISTEDKKLIDGLIQAAISYWPTIGECSVDGFRGNWLVRDGLLAEHADKWELTVEKRAYDILIHKSPFSFSIIKYPWMDKPLHVTWPY